MKSSVFEIIKCALLAGILAVLTLFWLRVERVAKSGLSANISAVGGRDIGGGEIPVSMADPLDVNVKNDALDVNVNNSSLDVDVNNHPTVSIEEPVKVDVDDTVPIKVQVEQ